MDTYKQTFKAWDLVAERYMKKFMDMDMYNRSYDFFCDLIPGKGAKIFEIGCGPGNITRYLGSKRPDFQIEAIDVAPNMVKLAASLNPMADFSVVDCRDLKNITGLFDGIMIGFCMPYLSKEDCLKLIHDCSRLSLKSGALYISFLEAESYYRQFETSGTEQEGMYVHYHEAAYLIDALLSNGFEVREQERKFVMKQDGTNTIQTIIISRKA